jgi:hypothetical protein
VGKGGEMTQTLYVHMNKIKKRISAIIWTKAGSQKKKSVTLQINIWLIKYYLIIFNIIIINSFDQIQY